MARLTAGNVGVSAVAVLSIAGLAAGWFGIEQTVPTPATPVTDQPYEFGAGVKVQFTAPDGWFREPTGKADIVRFSHPRGSILVLRTTVGVQHFANAAPRRLRELKIGGVDAQFTGSMKGAEFTGRTCTASAGTRTGDCAVVVHNNVMVTVLTLRSADAPLADLTALVQSMREL